MEKISNPDEKLARQYLNKSILHGHQLSHIKELTRCFRKRTMQFDQLKGQVCMGYEIMRSLPGFDEAVKEILDQKKSKSATSRKQKRVYDLEDLEPKSWGGNDPQLRDKIGNFTDLLSQALDNCREQ